MDSNQPALREALSGTRLFLSGGTGFFGKNLLGFLRNIDMDVVVLSRSPERFISDYSLDGSTARITLIRGDIRSFAFPDGPFDFVIHGAAAASAKMNAERPLEMMGVITDGTRRVLDFAVGCGARRFLFISSGAVYGIQPPELEHIPESFSGAPDPLAKDSAYGEGKRLAESMCAACSRMRGLSWSSARCFAFVGPHLPLDAHFAVGNFIAGTLKKDPITILGDGTPYRSYMHSSDLVEWLLTILICGRSGEAYNVGSEQAISIRDLAYLVRDCAGTANKISLAEKADPASLPSRYVPSAAKAGSELRLGLNVDLRDAIIRTISWYRAYFSRNGGIIKQ